MKIETTKDKEKVLKAVDTEIEEMMKAIRRSAKITKENKKKPKTEINN